MPRLRLLAASVAAMTGLPAVADDATQLDAVEVVSTGLASPQNPQIGTGRVEVRQAGLIRDVLRDMPGVDVGGTNGFNQQIYMRGVGSQGLNITIDGARQQGNTYHHNGDLLIDPALLKRVDISVGANSVADGAGALGGAVRFTTVSASDVLAPGQTVGGRVKVGYASNNDELQTSLMGYGRVADRLDLLGYVNRRGYGFGESGDGRQIGGDGTDVNYLFKTALDLAHGQKVTLSAERVKLDGDYPFRPEFPVTAAQRANLTDVFPQTYTRETQRLAYELNPEHLDWLNLSFNAYRTDRELVRSRPHRLADEATRDKFKGRKIDVKTTGATLENRAQLKAGSTAHTLRTGYEWYTTKNGYTPTGAEAGKPVADGEEATSQSLWIEDAVMLGNFVLTPGLRYDHYKIDMMGGGTVDNRKAETFSELSKALGLQYYFDSGLGLFANYTELFRGPEIIEGSRLILFRDYKQRSALKPETGDNKEIGFSYERSGLLSANDGFGMTAKYFRSDYDNLIIAGRVPSIPTLIDRFNGGAAQVKGVELSLRYRLDAFSASLGYSHARTRFTDSTEVVVRGSKTTSYGDVIAKGRSNVGDKIALGLDYRIAPLDTLVSWNTIYVRGLHDGDVYKKPYAVSDLSFSWKPTQGKLKGLEVTAGVYNLFDRAYASHTSRVAYTGADSRADVEPGRNIKVSVGWRF